MLRFCAIALICASALSGGSASSQETERCAALIGPDDSITKVALPGFSVTAATPPLSAPNVQGQLRAIMCGRSSIRIEPNDYRVITDFNVPFYIVSDDRMVVLQIQDGRLEFRFDQGQVRPQEEKALQQGLNQAQLAVQGEHPQ